MPNPSKDKQKAPDKNERALFINKLADLLNSIQKPHPILVAIDGIDTAGKTTLANELISPLTQKGRQVIRASIDGFHHPRVKRYRQGSLSSEGYYFDSFNYDDIVEKLLTPLTPNGNREYKTATFNFRTDSPVDSPILTSSNNAILLFEGVFLFRPELNKYWDYRIFVEISFEEMLRRSVRDAELFGSKEATLERFKKRYLPGQKIYLNKVHPQKIADILINNNNPREPKFLRI